MKRILSLLALSALAGCAVVPYDAGYPVNQYGAVYAPPAVYAPAYVGPPAYFGFGLNYRSGGGHYHRGYRGGPYRGFHGGYYRGR